MFSMMLFIFLCFFGLLSIMYYALRQSEKQFRSLREDNAQLRIQLRALEARLEGKEPGCLDPDANRPDTDPLLHLSFDEAGPAAAEAAAPQEQKAVDPALDLHFDPQPEENRKN